MIVYLGLPRCASSWIHNHLDPTGTKETHYLYTNPTDPIEYAKNRSFDFSTNNWSMDSNIARAIDPYVTKYILIIRDPVDVAISYRTMFAPTQSLDDFVSTMIVNKLLCYGDIIERWYGLVEPDKIGIFKYDDLLRDNQKFLIDLATYLEISPPNFISLIRTNMSVNKKHDVISQENLKILQQQLVKFEKITNLTLGITINT